MTVATATRLGSYEALATGEAHPAERAGRNGAFSGVITDFEDPQNNCRIRSAFSAR
jgi:hypothetical protein